MVLIKVDKFGYMNVGDVTLASKKSKAKAFIKFYSGVKWVLFKNSFYYCLKDLVRNIIG